MNKILVQNSDNKKIMLTLDELIMYLKPDVMTYKVPDGEELWNKITVELDADKEHQDFKNMIAKWATLMELVINSGFLLYDATICCYIIAAKQAKYYHRLSVSRSVDLLEHTWKNGCQLRSWYLNVYKQLKPNQLRIVSKEIKNYHN